MVLTCWISVRYFANLSLSAMMPTSRSKPLVIDRYAAAEGFATATSDGDGNALVVEEGTREVAGIWGGSG